MKWAALPIALLVGVACTAKTPAPTAASTASPASPDATPPSPTESLEALRDAFEFARAGDDAPRPEDCAAWPQALDELWAAHGAPLAEALILEGFVLRWCGRPGEAAEAFKRAAADGPRWAKAEALVGLAALRYDEHDDVVAASLLRRALVFDPGLESARLQLAKLLRAGFPHDPSAQRAAEIEQLLSPVDLVAAPERFAELAWFRYHQALAEEREPGEALVMAQQLLQQEHEGRLAGQAYALLGTAQRRRGDDVNALRYFWQAAEADATNSEAWMAIAHISISQRHFVAAVEALSHAQQDPRYADRPDVLLARASALTNLREYGRAALVLERAMEANSGDPAVAYARAHLAEVQAHAEPDDWTRERHLAEAAMHYREYLRHAPDEQAESRTHAADFLRDYATVERVETPERRRGRRNPL